MPWFKRVDVGDFFLNEEHPYSKKRTIKLGHVTVALGGLCVLVLVIGSQLEKRALNERVVQDAAREAQKATQAPGGFSTSANSPRGQEYISIQSSYGGLGLRGGGAVPRQRTATQIIKNGEPDALPMGSAIPVALIGNVESTDSNSPVTAIILVDALSPGQGVVIPRGTKAIGHGQLDVSRKRLQVRFSTLVFPDGEQFSVSALAAMPDGSSGITGRFSSGAFGRQVSQFVGTFIGGLAQGMKDRAPTGGIPMEPGSLKNGVLNGLADSSMSYAKSSAESAGQNSTASIKVDSGTQFVLYLDKEFHQ